MKEAEDKLTRLRRMKLMVEERASSEIIDFVDYLSEALLQYGDRAGIGMEKRLDVLDKHENVHGMLLTKFRAIPEVKDQPKMERNILEPLLSRPAVVNHLKWKGGFVWVGEPEGLTLSFVPISMDEEDSESSGRYGYGGYDSEDEQSVYSLYAEEKTFVESLVQILSTNGSRISVDDLNKYPCLLDDFHDAVWIEDDALMDRVELTEFLPEIRKLLENKWVQEYVTRWHEMAFEWDEDEDGKHVLWLVASGVEI